MDRFSENFWTDRSRALRRTRHARHIPAVAASYLLCRSSPGMHHSFRNSRLFGRLLTDWEDRGGIRQKDKSRAIVVVLMCSGGTLCFGNLSATLTSMIVALVSVGLFVILRVPLVRDSE